MFALAKFDSETVSDSDKQQLHDSYVTVTTVLALATLGGTTQIGSFLFFCHAAQGGQGKYSSDSHVAVM
jgi:hypothetical protein